MLHCIHCNLFETVQAQENIPFTINLSRLRDINKPDVQGVYNVMTHIMPLEPQTT
jgi:hypothetical protein